MHPLERNYVEAGYIAGDGDNGRLDEAISAYKLRRETWFFVHTICLIYASILVFLVMQCWWLSIFLHTCVFAMGLQNHEYFNNPLIYHLYLLGALLPALEQIICYRMYYVLEADAFNSFEQLLPAFEEGRGDCVRLQFFSWSVAFKYLWCRKRSILIHMKDNIVPILEYIIYLLLLWYIGIGINELYFYYSQVPASFKLIHILPILISFKKIPCTIKFLIILDMQTNTFTPVIYKTLGPISWLSLLLPWTVRCFGLWMLWMKARKIQRRRRREIIPDAVTVVLMLFGRYFNDPDAEIATTLIMFTRWMHLTGQEQRIRLLDVDALVLNAAIPAPLQEELPNDENLEQPQIDLA
jgi:hypothetical protein